MSEGKKIDLKWVIIIFAVTVIGMGIFIVMSISGDKSEESVAELLADYEELESAYSKAIGDIENVSEKDYENIESIKGDLAKTIENLRKEQLRIAERRRRALDGDTTAYDDLMADNTPLDDMAEENIGQFEYKTEDGGTISYDTKQLNEIIYISKQLEKQNAELEKNLRNIRTYFEKEKAKNQNLNAAINELNESMEKLESQGTSKMAELETIKKQRDKIQKDLNASNKKITKQTAEINMMVETLRKANVDCYFTYEKGNAEKETKIYLTSEGISKVYLNYFLSKKPKLHIDFKLNKALLDAGIEKVNIRIANSKNFEVFSTNKTISKPILRQEIEGHLFPKGEYRIELRNGPEDLIIGGEYKFKIGI